MVSFETFFLTVHGYSPFKWQCELAEILVSNRWHDQLILPPSVGKTNIITVWYYALYRNILSGTMRNVPIRLWFVIDRKVVVDEAHKIAKSLRIALCKEECQQIAHVIKSHFGCDVPLVIGKMRGGLDR